MIENLTDAISHAREVAKNWESQLVNCVSEEGRNKCKECAAEHEQLAKWLERLEAIIVLYDEFKEYGGGFHYLVGRVLDDDYALLSNALYDKGFEAGYDAAKKDHKRPEGKWKTVEGYDGDEYYECSNCGEPWFLESGTPKDNNMNFCPNCGADMRKEGEEDG